MKTFPLYFEDKQHEELKKAAIKQGKSIKEFILEAIKDKIQKVG
jgi:predicted HicB family RNase H-like nuclease